MIRLPTLPTLLGERRRRARRRPRPLAWPKRGELQYAARLVGLARQASALVEQLVTKRLDQVLRESMVRTDDLADTLVTLFKGLYEALGLSDDRARSMSIEMLETVQRDHARVFGSMYEPLLAINPLLGQEPWLLEQMRVAVTENARLIQSVPTGLVDDVSGIITRGVLDGTRVEQMAQLIRARYGITQRHAAFIARDQTAKWFGSLNRLRQLDAGVSEYEWSTVRDGNVRPTHQANEGKIFRWDKPPAKTGHPGHDPLCRCQPLAVIPDVEE